MHASGDISTAGATLVQQHRIYCLLWATDVVSLLISRYLYADDTHLYISFSADNTESFFYRLRQCLNLCSGLDDHQQT